jgi:Na+/melibiose symporter-like transporter
MVLTRFFRLLHLFFAFSFVGSLVVAEWNGRAARMTQSWSERATLFQIVYLTSRLAGLGSLIMLGIFGNLLAPGTGHRMSSSWLMLVNGLWIAMLLVTFFIALPNAQRLAEVARGAAQGGADTGFERALARWRFGNVIQSALYLAFLSLMVFHWAS